MNAPALQDHNALIDEAEALQSAYNALAMLARGANEKGFTYTADPGHVADILDVLNSQQSNLVEKLLQSAPQIPGHSVHGNTATQGCHAGH